MPAARLGYIPWYASDWMTSKTRRGFTPAQRSAYFDLLNEMYLSDGGSIAIDYKDFERLTGVKLNDLRTVVERAFVEVENGRITHPRVQKELARIGELREIARAAGVKSGVVRKFKSRKKINGGSTGVPSSLNAHKMSVEPTEQIRTDLKDRSPDGRTNGPIATPRAVVVDIPPARAGGRACGPPPAGPAAPVDPNESYDDFLARTGGKP